MSNDTAVKEAVGKFSVKDGNTRNVMQRIFFFFTPSKIVTGPKVQSAEGNMTTPQAVTCQGPSSAKRTRPACLCGSHISHKFVSLQGAK